MDAMLVVLGYKSAKHKTTLRWWGGRVGFSAGESKAQAPGKRGNITPIQLVQCACNKKAKILVSVGLLPGNFVVSLQIRLHPPLHKKVTNQLKLPKSTGDLLLGGENSTGCSCHWNRFWRLARFNSHQSAELLVLLSVPKVGRLPFIPAER